MSTRAKRTIEPISPPEPGARAARDNDDVEGHSFMNPGIAQDLARAREREMEKKAARYRLEMEARRPHRRER